MFKTSSELQDFITWAKDQKVKRLKVGDVEVEFTELAFLTEAVGPDALSGGASTLADTEPKDPKEDEEALYWSSN